MEVDTTILSTIGIAAGILILSGWVEQVYKGYKTKRLKDISKYLMVFMGAGAVLWAIYGVLISDVFVIATNIAAVALMGMVLGMKSKYDRQTSKNSMKN